VKTSRVAQVTFLFWVIKILTTGMGETGADYLDHTYEPVIVVVAAFVALVLALVWQLSSPKYSALRYWTAVTMVSVFGTLAADAVHVVIGVPYWVSTVAFAVALVAAFAAWKRTHGNLEMAHINTRSRELFYWLIVLISFALGTAAGDWIAMGLGLGFLAGSVLFTAAFAAPLLLQRVPGVSATLAFWLAYTFTRPMGASIADWLALPSERGGLGYGTLAITLVWTSLIIAVASLSARPARKRVWSTSRH